MNESRKYCRSLHAHISLGTTSDDRFMPNGYVKAFADMDELVVTEKLDGQNNCFSKHGVFARSHTAPTTHPWDKPMRERWELIKDDLGDLEVFGENMYGIHSVAYKKLESYFYVFAVREGDYWLSWDEVKDYAAVLDLPTVPEIRVKSPLRAFVATHSNENKALEAWLTDSLGMSWEASVQTPGQLGGYDFASGEDASEGFVIRNKKGFQTNSGILPTANNEFDNLFKLVRESHVKTDLFWAKNWQPATLTDYARYGWHAYEYLNQRG